MNSLGVSDWQCCYLMKRVMMLLVDIFTQAGLRCEANTATDGAEEMACAVR